MDIVRKKLEAFCDVYKETGFNSVENCCFTSASLLLHLSFLFSGNVHLNDDPQSAVLQNILYWGKGYQTPSETLLNRCQKISRSSYETIKRKNSILTSSLLFLPSPASSLPLSSLSPSFGGSNLSESFISDQTRCAAEGTQDHNLHLQIWRPGWCAEECDRDKSEDERRQRHT